MNRKLIIIALIFSLSVAFLYIHIVYAAAFTTAYVRFDRLKANTPTTGLICATPASSGTENNLQVTFPSDFNVSTNLTHWSVSIASLPTGATAWPGMGSANLVVGQTVTFPSDDLTSGVLYCFNWTNSSAVTTGTTGSTQGTLTTRTVLGGTIDSSAYYLTVKSNDQISVTATVPAKSTDAEVTLSSTPTTSTTLSPSQEATFTVSYRSLLNSSQPFTLEAYWEQGLVQGSSSNYIDIFDYVIGSATQSEDGTTPTVDLINKRITWQIPVLSPSTSFKTVAFSLHVRSQLPTNKYVSSAVKARGQLATAYTPEQSLTFTILQVASPSPTLTNTPTSANSQTPAPTSATVYATATPAPSATPTSLTVPTLAPMPLRFNNVSIEDITRDKVIISFSTNLKTSFVISYGVQANKLQHTIVSKSSATKHRIELSPLVPKTRYYFRIKITDENNPSINSDIFTFETAEADSTFVLHNNDVIISSQDIVLNTSGIQNIVIPKSHPFGMTVRVSEPENIQSLRAVFKNDTVLGINNIVPPPPVEEVQLLEVLPGQFAAKLLTSQDLGKYSIQLYIKDVYGGSYTRRIPYNIYVSNPLTIRDHETSQPIENAKISIVKYESSLKRYSPFDERFSVALHTDEKGELHTALPQGTYIVEISADGYKAQKQEFELGLSTNYYPIFSLQATYSIGDTAQYFMNSSKVVQRFVLHACRNYFVSRIARNISIGLSLIMTLIIIIISIRRIESPSLIRRTPYFYFIESLLLYISINFALITVLMTVGFISIQGFRATLPLLLICVVIFSLVGYYLVKVKRELFS